MITTATKQRRPKGPGGRPKEFDEGEALERAMYVFWRKGYEGTSMSDIDGGDGDQSARSYRTFGNKEALFWKVLERFGEGPAAYVMGCLQEPTAFEVVKARLYGAVETMTDPRHPWGCLATQAAATCGDEGESVRKGLISVRAGTQAAMAERLRRAKAEGDSPAAAGSRWCRRSPAACPPRPAARRRASSAPAPSPPAPRSSGIRPE